MDCKICGKGMTPVFRKKVLFRYDVDYYRCENCLFVQTDNPFWLEEAYRSAITSLDIGLVSRNLYLCDLVGNIIKLYFDKGEKFLDYGGGYGLLVRLMRDAGFNFFREDKFCDNLFAANFDVTDAKAVNKFELLTAFELFEHLETPMQEIEHMLSKSASILFSTVLQPTDEQLLESWEYIAPEIGQHVSFFHQKTLLHIAERFGMNLYTNDRNIHLLTNHKLNTFFFKMITKPRLARLLSSIRSPRNTLLQADYQMIKRKLSIQNEIISE